MINLFIFFLVFLLLDDTSSNSKGRNRISSLRNKICLNVIAKEDEALIEPSTSSTSSRSSMMEKFQQDNDGSPSNYRDSDELPRKKSSKTMYKPKSSLLESYNRSKSKRIKNKYTNECNFIDFDVDGGENSSVFVKRKRIDEAYGCKTEPIDCYENDLSGIDYSYDNEKCKKIGLDKKHRIYLKVKQNKSSRNFLDNDYSRSQICDFSDRMMEAIPHTHEPVSCRENALLKVSHDAQNFSNDGKQCSVKQNKCAVNNESVRCSVDGDKGHDSVNLDNVQSMKTDGKLDSDCDTSDDYKSAESDEPESYTSPLNLVKVNRDVDDDEYVEKYSSLNYNDNSVSENPGKFEIISTLNKNPETTGENVMGNDKLAGDESVKNLSSNTIEDHVMCDDSSSDAPKDVEKDVVYNCSESGREAYGVQLKSEVDESERESCTDGSLTKNNDLSGDYVNLRDREKICVPQQDRETVLGKSENILTCLTVVSETSLETGDIGPKSDVRQSHEGIGVNAKEIKINSGDRFIENLEDVKNPECDPPDQGNVRCVPLDNTESSTEILHEPTKNHINDDIKQDIVKDLEFASDSFENDNERPVVEIREVDGERIVEESIVEEPSEGEPNEEEPVVEEPNEGEPFVEDPTVGEPSEGDPTAEEPNEEEPNEGDPTAEEPIVEEPNEKEPNEGEPLVEESNEGEPFFEEPILREPHLKDTLENSEVEDSQLSESSQNFKADETAAEIDCTEKSNCSVSGESSHSGGFHREDNITESAYCDEDGKKLLTDTINDKEVDDDDASVIKVFRPDDGEEFNVFCSGGNRKPEASLNRGGMNSEVKDFNSSFDEVSKTVYDRIEDSIRCNVSDAEGADVNRESDGSVSRRQNIDEGVSDRIDSSVIIIDDDDDRDRGTNDNFVVDENYLYLNRGVGRNTWGGPAKKKKPVDESVMGSKRIKRGPPSDCYRIESESESDSSSDSSSSTPSSTGSSSPSSDSSDSSSDSGSSRRNRSVAYGRTRSSLCHKEGSKRRERLRPRKVSKRKINREIKDPDTYKFQSKSRSIVIDDDNEIETKVGDATGKSNAENDDDKRPLKCDMCRYSCKIPGTLRKHKAKEHADTAGSNVLYACTNCSYVNTFKEDIKKHIDNKHDCRCSYTIVTNRSDYYNYEYDFFQVEIPYPCRFCNYVTTMGSDMDNHMWYRHRDIIEALSDFRREKRSKTSSDSYQQSHYICQCCDFKTRHADIFDRHVSKSHAKRTYRCDYCSYTTLRKCEMNKHKAAIHETDSLHVCNLCSFRTTRKSHLSRHILLKHTNDYVFSCRYCCYKTTSTKSFSHHVEMEHT